MEDDLIKPEELNKLLKFSLTFSWVILSVTLIFIIALIIWSSTASIPIYIEGNAVLMNRSLVRAILSNTNGLVTTVNVKKGEKVSAGKVMSTIKEDKNGCTLDVTASDDFTVMEQWIYPSFYIRESEPLFTVEKENYYKEPFLIAFVSIDEAGMVEPGMEVSLSFLTCHNRGLIKGRVTKISPHPVSSELMFYELGNREIAEYIKSRYSDTDTPLVDLIITILTNSDGTYEGMGKIPDEKIETGTLCQYFIIADRQTFLEKFFPWLAR